MGITHLLHPPHQPLIALQDSGVCGWVSLRCKLSSNAGAREIMASLPTLWTCQASISAEQCCENTAVSSKSEYQDMDLRTATLLRRPLCALMRSCSQKSHEQPMIRSPLHLLLTNVMEMMADVEWLDGIEDQSVHSSAACGQTVFTPHASRPAIPFASCRATRETMSVAHRLHCSLGHLAMLLSTCSNLPASALFATSVEIHNRSMTPRFCCQQGDAGMQASM